MKDEPHSMQPTRWTLVREAQGDDETSRQALADLCEAYWQPVFRFLRYEGRAEDNARELTQAFFAKLLESRNIKGADPSRGKFRTYVLGAVKHFLADQRKAANREKRGGGRALEPLDTNRESAPGLQVADPRSGIDDTLFDREWAYTVLDRALEALKRAWEVKGKSAEFTALKPWLTGSTENPRQGEVAFELGISANHLKVTIHRLRKAFRNEVRSEISQTVVGDQAIAEELRYLLEVVSR